MSLTKAIFDKSVFWLALIPLFAVWGFWFTYFKRPPGSITVFEHLHGIAMFGWVLLLVLQAGLIRTKRRTIHRQTGKLAYVLGPWIFITTIVLANYQLNIRGLTQEALWILAMQFFTLIQFTVFLAMAISRRKQPDVHARWMICTAFTLIDPILVRILGINFLHVSIESGILQLITFSFIDLIVLTLVFKDWRSGRRRDVFAPALILLVATQIPMLFVLNAPVWMAFATWFRNLPYS